MGIKRVNIFLNPVSDELRSLRSHDPNDRWLVQEIWFDEKEYENATHVLVGCPQDEGVRRNNGRTGAAEAPLRIREQLYRLQTPGNPGTKLFDAGDVIIDTSDKNRAVENTHDRLSEAVSEFLADGKKVIVLGGGNDISYADVRALSKTEREISAVNIDAHLDMRIADKMTSGTPYRKLIENGYLEANLFYEFGIRPESNAALYLENAGKMGVNIRYLQEILENGASRSFQIILDEIGNRPFFLGLDMDSVQAADAPGVSASSPVGFSGREVMQLVRLARQKENLRLFEITEVNPKFDVNARTVRLSAQLVYSFLFG